MIKYSIVLATAADTEQLDNLIRFFNISRMVCGILAVVFFLLTIFLFWKLEIWRTMLERTGVARKKSISAMQELNATTGRLVKSSGAQIAAQEFYGQLTDDRKKAKKAKRTGDISRTPPPVNFASPNAGFAANMETSLLKEPGTEALSAPAAFGGRFILTVNQQIIHTDEEIGR